MAYFDPAELSKKENYKLLTSMVTPRPIAFITSISEEGIINAAPFSYFNIISADPPLVSVSIGRKKGMQKDTARNILQTKEFVIQITDEDNVKQANEASANLKPEESELKQAKLTPAVSKAIGVPSLKESKARLECRLERHLVFEGEDSATDVIIGRVVSYYADDKIVKDGIVQTDKMKPVGRLGGKQYAKLGKIFELERPE